MSEALSKVEEIQKLQASASWHEENTDIGLSDHSYRAFCEVMKYRREVARDYFRTRDEEMKDNLLSVFRDCNKKIREILSL